MFYELKYDPDMKGTFSHVLYPKPGGVKSFNNAQIKFSTSSLE